MLQKPVNMIGHFCCRRWVHNIDIKGWVKKKGLALTHNYFNPNKFCDFNNHIVSHSPVFVVFKRGCNISVGQGTEFIRPDIVESRSQPLSFDSPFNSKLYLLHCRKNFLFYVPEQGHESNNIFQVTSSTCSLLHPHTKQKHEKTQVEIIYFSFYII